MIHLNTGPLQGVEYSTNTTLHARHFTVEQLIVATSPITLTLPTPYRGLAGKLSYFLNNSSGDLTLNGTFIEGASTTIATKTLVHIVCLPVSDGVFKWAQLGQAVTVNLDDQGIIKTVAGGMWTGNTETGISISYDSGAGKMNAVVSFGDAPPLVGPGASTAGTANFVSRSDHSHSLDDHDHLSSGEGGTIAHTSLSSIGSNTHAQIDTFIGTKAAASGLASLNSSSLVVQNPANATATPGAAKIPIADGSGKLDAWVTSSGLVSHTHADAAEGGTVSHTVLTEKGATTHADIDSFITSTVPAYFSVVSGHDHDGADSKTVSHTVLTDKGSNTHANIDTFISSKAAVSGLASLDGSSLVVQNPANATATPTASKIVIADGSGKVDGWITYGTTSGTSCQGNDSRLSDSRTPTSHTLEGHTATVTTGKVLTGTGVNTFAWEYPAPTWAQVDKTTSSIADIAQRSHTDLTDKGTNSHVNIDSHIGSTSNPHSVTYSQVGAQPLDAQLTDLAGLSPVHGNILYYTTAGAAALLAPGTSGNVLKTAGAGANPAWGTLTYSDVGAAAASHAHAGTDITSSTVAVAYGGTGPTTGSITGTTALTFTAGGSAQDVTLVSSTTGSCVLKPGSNSTTAIKLANAAGTAILTTDTTNNRVGINTTPSTTLHALSTTTQLRLSYDGTYFTDYACTSGGGITITPSHNSTSAHQFMNAAGTAILKVDTSNSRVGVNSTPTYTFESIGGDGHPDAAQASNHAMARFLSTAGGTCLDISSSNSTGRCYLQHRSAAADSTYYNLVLQPLGGKVGIGTGVAAQPAKRLEVMDTATQLRLSYDGTYFGEVACTSAGALKYTPSHNSTTAHQFTNAAGTAVLAVNTSGNAAVISDGTASLTAMAANADSTFYFVTTTNHHIRFGTNNQWNRMQIDATGVVGIGTGAGTPAKRLEVLDAGGGAQLRLSHTAATYYCDNTVDSSGNLTVTPSGGVVNVSSTASYSPQLQLISNTDTGAAYFIVKKSRAGTTALQDGDSLLTSQFYGYQNSNWRMGASISVKVDGAPSGDYVPGKFIFATATAAATPAERMCITSAGAVTFTGTIGLTGTKVSNSYHTNITSTNAVTVDSDERWKEDISDTYGLNLVQSIPARSFKWREDSGRADGLTHYGFVAQEVRDRLDKLGIKNTGIVRHDKENDEYGLATGELIPILWTAVQQLSERLTALEAV